MCCVMFPGQFTLPLIHDALTTPCKLGKSCNESSLELFSRTGYVSNSYFLFSHSCLYKHLSFHNTTWHPSSVCITEARNLLFSADMQNCVSMFCYTRGVHKHAGAWNLFGSLTLSCPFFLIYPQCIRIQVCAHVGISHICIGEGEKGRYMYKITRNREQNTANLQS